MAIQGCVTDVSVIDGDVVMLRGTGASPYKFRCYLKNFVCANDFCQSLSVDNAEKFCLSLEEKSNNVVKYVRAESKKRERSEDDSPAASKKARLEDKDKRVTKKIELKKAEIQGDIQKELSLQAIGTYDIDLNQLLEPPEYLRIREVRSWYVDYLAEMMENAEEDHEDLTSPLLVVASVKKEEFRTQNIKKYSFQIIGGVQRFAAITKVNNKENGRKILSRKCSVYGGGMSRQSLLFLAKQHNDFNQIQRETTFPEVAASCRRLLYAHFANGAEDDGEYMPKVPRYNTEDYRKFKLECVSYLHSPRLSKVYIETAIQMAIQPSEVYHTMQRVFEMFEEGKLKGQKNRAYLTEIRKKKAMQGQFSAKIHHFKMFQGLQDEDKLEVLSELAEGTISIDEACVKIKQIKSWKVTREVFTKQVKVNSWEDAKQQFPLFADKSKLIKFQLKSDVNLPQVFKDYCSQALASTVNYTDCEPDVDIFIQDKSTLKLYVIAASSLNTMIPNKWPLVVLDLHEVKQMIVETVLIITIPTEFDGQSKQYTGRSSIVKNQCTTWTLIIHRLDASLLEVEAVCKGVAGIALVKSFTVCSVLSETVKSDEHVQLVKGYPVIVGWIGIGSPPEDHIIHSDCDTIICHPAMELTQLCTSEPLVWLRYVVNSCHATGHEILELYSLSSEAAQVSIEKGMDCTCVQSTVQGVEKFRDLFNHEDIPDTNQILEDLSAAEKMALAVQPTTITTGEGSVKKNKHAQKKDENKKKSDPKKYPIRSKGQI